MTSSAAAPQQSSYAIQVDATKEWTDTQIDLRGGEKLKITAEGTITYSDHGKDGHWRRVSC